MVNPLLSINVYEITIKVPKIEIIQKDDEGFSLYFIAANKDMAKKILETDHYGLKEVLS